MTTYKYVNTIIAEGDEVQIPENAERVNVEYFATSSPGIGGAGHGERQAEISYLKPV